MRIPQKLNNIYLTEGSCCECKENGVNLSVHTKRSLITSLPLLKSVSVGPRPGNNSLTHVQSMFDLTGAI